MGEGMMRITVVGVALILAGVIVAIVAARVLIDQGKQGPQQDHIQ